MERLDETDDKTIDELMPPEERKVNINKLI